MDLRVALGLLKGARGGMIHHGDEEGRKLGFDLAGANSSSSGPYLNWFLYQLVADAEFFQSYLLVGFKSRRIRSIRLGGKLSFN
jgi:hypothetical protein